ncbi:MAG: hypothetical protein ACRBFS_13495 [Aureispira sp.]
MKTSQILMKFSLLSMVLFVFTACQPECNCPDKSLTRELEDTRPFKQQLIGSIGEQVNQLPTLGSIKFSMDMLPEGIEPQDLDLFTNAAIEAKSENFANVEATELVTSIFNALIAAESPNSQLDVKFLVSEEPVENGSLIFVLEVPEARELTLTMYDEVDFVMVANNTIRLKEGNNYKALNVSNLEPGEYILKLTDENTSKEIVRRIKVAE